MIHHPSPRHKATGHPAGSRALGRFAAVLAVCLLATLGLAGPAAAHNVLTSSNPTDGSVLDAAPQTVTLTFDQPVQDFEPVVVVTGPDGAEYQSGTPVITGTTVEMQLSPLSAAGPYTVAYRIVSTDGHPVQGQLGFELSAAAAGASSSAAPSSGSASSAAEPTADSAASTASAAPPAASPSTSASASTSPSAVSSTADPTTGSAAVAPAASSDGLSGWVWAALAVAALLVVAAVVVIARRPRS